MWRWIIDAIVVVMMILGVVNECLPKKSKWRKRVTIPVIALTALSALVGNHFSSAKGLFSQNVGVLTPKHKVSYKQQNPGVRLRWDTSSQICTIQTKDDVVVQPFGRKVPLSLVRTKKGLLVSMVVKSIDMGDKQIVAQMIQNMWVLNPNNYFQKNFDAHALEVIDQYGIPILQVEYLDATTLRIGGVFFGESANTSDIYRDFLSVADNARDVAFFDVDPNGVLILGKGTMFVTVQPLDASEIEEIRLRAKKYIEPWFDYSDPEKIGVRKKQEVDKSIVINKSDRRKCSKLTNTQLKDKVSTFVRDLRDLLAMCDKEMEAALTAYASAGDSKSTL